MSEFKPNWPQLGAVKAAANEDNKHKVLGLVTGFLIVKVIFEALFDAITADSEEV